MSSTVPKPWKANTSYTRGELLYNLDNQLVKSINSHNSGSSYDLNNYSSFVLERQGEYSQARLTVGNFFNTGTPVKFDAFEGTIPYDVNTGYWTLKAGRAYKLIANIAPNLGLAANHKWKDITNDTFIGSAGKVYSMNSTADIGNVRATAIITPSTDIVVALIVTDTVFLVGNSNQESSAIIHTIDGFSYNSTNHGVFNDYASLLLITGIINGDVATMTTYDASMVGYNGLVVVDGYNYYSMKYINNSWQVVGMDNGIAYTTPTRSILSSIYSNATHDTWVDTGLVITAPAYTNRIRYNIHGEIQDNSSAGTMQLDARLFDITNGTPISNSERTLAVTPSSGTGTRIGGGTAEYTHNVNISTPTQYKVQVKKRTRNQTPNTTIPLYIFVGSFIEHETVGVGNAVSYSTTEEVNTGQRWIDGKVIYQKTFTGTTPASFVVTTLFTIPEATGEVINYNGFLNQQGLLQGRRSLIESIHSGNDTHGQMFQVHDHDLVSGKTFRYSNYTTDTRWQNAPYTVTMYYTKA